MSANGAALSGRGTAPADHVQNRLWKPRLQVAAAETVASEPVTFGELNSMKVKAGIDRACG